MKIIKFFSLLTVLLFHLLMNQASAQSGFSFEIAKPKNYESRKLPSEKTGERKFTAPKRFFTNLVSRFNYYFNAENKLNEALTAAKQAHQDDYTKLLSFYNYSLDETAKQPIDSIIYKCTAGILLHDLRSDWVDKLYLLMGQAYLYRKDFDSANTVFQYINYAFAPKDNGYDIPIGSNASNTNGVFTIATLENRSLWKRIASFPPSRNEAFLWQVRTFIEQDQLIEAASLLELLKSDPNFPARLKPHFNELMAYTSYKQGYNEKAADYLLLSIQHAENKLEQARKEYLAGQLYQLANQSNKAILAFQKSIKQRVDPVMEVFARINLVELSNASAENALQKNLDELLGMAKKDKYAQYRDIIYYAAAQLALKEKNTAKAEQLLLTSIEFCQDNEKQKQQNFLQLGNITYAAKQYAKANSYYDSIQLNLLAAEDAQKLAEIKPAIAIIAANQSTIQREDSLQLLGKLSAAQLEAEIKKVLKQLKKEKGIKESASELTNQDLGNNSNNNLNLFGNKSNDFYFSNASLKERGKNDFNIKWGNRPNVDNWRRQAAVNGSLLAGNQQSNLGNAQTGTVQKDLSSNLSFESLLNNIPISPIEIEQSQKAILKAFMENGLTFQNQLEDYPKAIEMFEELRKRFPEGSEAENALNQLYFCYQKINAPEKANEVFQSITQTYPNSEFAKQLIQAKNNPNAPKVNNATLAYQQVYEQFISGNFEAAKKAKELADNQFGKHYWTPQLLYIESIYYIKQKEDSTAINRLQNLSSLFANTVLAQKANTMIQVLRNRDSIENYLTNLQLDPNESYATRGILLDEQKPVLANNTIKKEPAIQVPSQLNTNRKELADITNKRTVSTAIPIKKDSSQMAAPKLVTNKTNLTNSVSVAKTDSKTYQFNVADTQYVAVILNKVDPIFISEARNAFNRFNSEFFNEKRIDIAARKINDQVQFIMIGPFENAAAALGYIDRAKPQAKPRIIPWLAPDKYSFNMISNFNMNLLISTQDLAGYLTFIHKLFPDKF